MFTKKYRSMNEQINPSQELVNKVINSIEESPAKAKKQNLHKTFIKLALPAMMILCVFCVHIIGGNMTKIEDAQGLAETPKNWFGLVAYAEDMPAVEITKDMKVKLPSGAFIMHEPEEGMTTGSVSFKGEIGFKIDGDNIESVNFKSENCTFVKPLRNWDDFLICSIELDSSIYQPGKDLRDLWENDEFFAKIKEEYFQGISQEYSDYGWSSYSEGISDKWRLDIMLAEIRPHIFGVHDIIIEKDLLDLPITWIPENLFVNRYSGDYKEYLTDIITITATFNDGEEITQFVEISIDEETGDIFAQIIG